MSYILEALRRAERERAQGQLPGGDAAGAPGSAPPARGPVLKLVIGLLALNAVVLTVLLVRHKPQVETDAAPIAAVPAPQAAPREAPLAAPTTAPAPVPVDEAAGTDQPAVVQQGVSSMDDLGVTGEDEPADEEPEPAAPRGSVTFAKKPLTRDAVKPPPAPADAAEDVAAEEPEVAADSEAATSPQAASATPAAPPAGAKALYDMSAAYQAAFPQFTLEVHVYDPAPQRRFAIIDGKRYHEGDALPQGPRLVQIVPEGLVVDFRNERVIYPIGRH